MLNEYVLCLHWCNGDKELHPRSPCNIFSWTGGQLNRKLNNWFSGYSHGEGHPFSVEFAFLFEEQIDTYSYRNFTRTVASVTITVYRKRTLLAISARPMADRGRRTSRRLQRSPAKDSEPPSTFNSWTVVKLRRELKRRGFITTGLKADLVT